MTESYPDVVNAWALALQATTARPSEFLLYALADNTAEAAKQVEVDLKAAKPGEFGPPAVPATPQPEHGTTQVSVIDMQNWQTVATIPTLGPGFFLRSHEDTPYIWADAMMGKASDGMQIIDKRTLEVVRVLKPAPGKIAAHTEFDRSGRHALVSVWDADGALVVYDAATLEERARLPMRKPSGNYNVYNKINFSDGTSH